MALLTFTEAIQDAQRYTRRHALLGNGFSIACRPNIFAYGKLYEQADFSKISATAKRAFEALGTQDFEKVIKSLRDAASIVSAYGEPPSLAAKFAKDAGGLRVDGGEAFARGVLRPLSAILPVIGIVLD